jgi:FAD/FMN-containing dehydrogenase
LRADLEHALEAALTDNLVIDAVIAGNRTQAQALWHMRESIPEGARQEPVMVYRHDIAVAVGRIPEFIREAQAALEARFPGVRLICFGHLGDGNLHYNAYLPDRLRTDAAAREAHDITETVYDIVQRYGGSFSAEHGIGLSKVAELAHYKSAVELDLMRTVKRALDPQGLMNPGKVL